MLFRIALACFLTVFLETAFFAAAGYRDRISLTIAASLNVVTNLLLNLAFLTAFSSRDMRAVIPAEALVVLSEYAVYALAFGGSGRLFMLTAAANALSYAAGRGVFSVL